MVMAIQKLFGQASGLAGQHCNTNTERCTLGCEYDFLIFPYRTHVVHTVNDM
jgi:hypothetical protein